MPNHQMTEALHDAQDAVEDLSARASSIVDETVKASIHELLGEVETLDDLFEPLALLVESRLADLTTEAVRSGFDSALVLREVSGG